MSRDEGLRGDPLDNEEERMSLVALAGCDSWLECLCPEPCWCIQDRFLSSDTDWEDSDLGVEAEG